VCVTADAKRDYLPRLVTFVGAFEHFMSITRSADRRLGGTKKHRAAVVKQAMAYESDDSDDEERALRTFDVKSKSGTPLSFKTSISWPVSGSGRVTLGTVCGMLKKSM
jgi:NAD+--asparagine ADP-ribosyltransferase